MQITHFNQNWKAFLVGRYTRLNHSIKESEMTGRSFESLIGVSITYHFE